MFEACEPVEIIWCKKLHWKYIPTTKDKIFGTKYITQTICQTYCTFKKTFKLVCGIRFYSKSRVGLGCISMQRWDFLNIFYFLRSYILSSLTTLEATRVKKLLTLWVKSSLTEVKQNWYEKHFKALKYYDQSFKYFW